ncbi:carboxymuconolactone decarboxylase family protein [Lactobacillus sp. LC28-10]|uniref:Carboxymuconolactone decarboxylase family protein n=1 Tax=Secundilactobacillus angelensis TaxID=2722706 RepID=A0ABX1L130_9LACO|nr:carboxymuconolactone decarboxylase family protein [Secundilactobacillus angelensis]MCH5462642.1 carboxymuconolactone decarboxylase family protein [Secundilactobacillus angelensis]NLR19134.1 carboxymuconolactone decarboxylase family protein [Secundilactobacillus angelensis]
MTVNYNDEMNALNASYKQVFSSVGEAGTGFRQLHADAVADGVLDSKTKELMAVAVAISIRCEGCITDHVYNAVKAGATEEEINETVKVAMMMSGGPGVIYGGKALAAAKTFLAAK